MVEERNCGLEVREFEFQSSWYVLFWTYTQWKSMNPIIMTTMGWLWPLLFFYKDGLGIK